MIALSYWTRATYTESCARNYVETVAETGQRDCSKCVVSRRRLASNCVLADPIPTQNSLTSLARHDTDRHPATAQLNCHAGGRGFKSRPLRHEP